MTGAGVASRGLGRETEVFSPRKLKANLKAAFFRPSEFGGVSIPPTANVPYTPHCAPADLAYGGSGHADTTNSCPTSIDEPEPIYELLEAGTDPETVIRAPVQKAYFDYYRAAKFPQ
jgi:hypothetical protein